MTGLRMPSPLIVRALFASIVILVIAGCTSAGSPQPTRKSAAEGIPDLGESHCAPHDSTAQ